ncbi:MAG TPA: pitrilysin family protein [Chitinophagaceae bacterium]|jgi:predicted Zn-dependent peptidase|nr:pitrilysin family protein [Chitinophagaceae bacterium]
MKKILSIAIICLASIPILLKAQNNKQPYDMMVNGIKVIVYPSGNEIVVIQTVIKGGVQNYAADKAGIENLAINGLTECGTTLNSKNSFKDKLDKVSAQVYGNTGMSFSSFVMNCIKSDFETVWPLYVEAMTKPAFDAKEFDRIKQDAINSIRASESNPDNAIDRMAKQTAFAGKPFAINPQGRVETVTNLTPSEVKKYWESIFTRSRMVIVVVADLDRSVIEKNMQQFLSKLPAGTAFVPKKESYMPTANSFKSQERANATNYVRGITSGPIPGTSDYNAFSLAMNIFSTRHFVEIRSKNGLSYAPGAWLSTDNTTYSNIYVTTTEPDKYIAVARTLIDTIKQKGFTKEELKNQKTSYLTGIYYRDETNQALAASLASNEVLHGDWKRTVKIKDDINKVTLDQLNSTFKRYFNNITWVYQGDPKKVNPVLYTQKETPSIPADKKAF